MRENKVDVIPNARGGCAFGAEFLVSLGMTCSSFIAILNALRIEPYRTSKQKSAKF
jgi:hypothetical protein